jgi:lysozyme family protein
MEIRLETLQPEYEQSFLSCRLIKEAESEVTQIAERLVELRSHYEIVERETGLPWWFAGVLHYLEWNFQEPQQFEQQVIDVLIAKCYHQARNRTLGAYLWGFDLWNGFRSGAGDESEWVWSGTNVINKTTDKVGAAAILIYLQDKQLIDIPKPKQGKRLVVLTDTVFKIKPEQSLKLQNDEKIMIRAGTRLDILEDELSASEHVRIQLPDGVLLGQNNRSDWYIYKGHVFVEGTEPDNNPTDEPEPPETKIAEPNRGRPITVPKRGTVYLGDPILEKGNFSWAEATKNGTRIPANAEVVDGMCKIAEVMEEVREYLGDRSIRVNSWYRDPSSNRRVGGAKDSRHMKGDAVDFVVEGISPPEVNRRLDGWWKDRGGLASDNSFTHIDARGYRARWRYGR